MGFANVYAMRVNLSVAIVAMVNNTAISHNRSSDNSSSCPVVGNITETATDGPFDWGEREQGWLLGAFFYGYVATQIPGGRMAEKYGGKMLYGVGVLITAVFTLLTPLAANTSIYALVSLPISGYLCDIWGWETVFYVFGSLGCVWYVFWWWYVFDNPNTHPHIDPV